MSSRKIITTIENGIRRIVGTNWPISTTVERIGPRDWLVTRGVCNGTASSTEHYRTRREALLASEQP